MSPDIELIRKAQAGNMSAFTELLQRHDRHVLSLVARHVESSEDAKDIYQEVMIKVFRGLPGFQFRSEFSTWIHRITVNTCLSYRRARPRSHVPLNETGADREDSPASQGLQSEDHGPDHAAIDSDTADHVRRALQALSPRQRMVFTLRHYEGQSLREIAQTLRCTEGTVKRYLFTATRRMREQLEGLF